MMHDYARQETADLIDRLAQAMNSALPTADAGAIHDIRVVIRRLRGCLRLFAPFYPDRYWKKIRHRLSGLMAAAAAVRDCDIALELLQEAGISPRTVLVTELISERRKAGRDLEAELRRWHRQNLLHEWKSRLEL